VLPFVIPTNFTEELFWYAASAGVPFPDGSLQLVEMALEAAFGTGTVTPIPNVATAIIVDLYGSALTTKKGTVLFGEETGSA
jgi:hypothetical protein